MSTKLNADTVDKLFPFYDKCFSFPHFQSSIPGELRLPDAELLAVYLAFETAKEQYRWFHEEES